MVLKRELYVFEFVSSIAMNWVRQRSRHSSPSRGGFGADSVNNRRSGEVKSCPRASEGTLTHRGRISQACLKSAPGWQSDPEFSLRWTVRRELARRRIKSGTAAARTGTWRLRDTHYPTIQRSTVFGGLLPPVRSHCFLQTDREQDHRDP